MLAYRCCIETCYPNGLRISIMEEAEVSPLQRTKLTTT